MIKQYIHKSSAVQPISWSKNFLGHFGRLVFIRERINGPV
jgi:hypothetical protein